MDIKEHIDYWLKSAAHDMEVAETLFKIRNTTGVYSLDIWLLKKSSKPFYVQSRKEIPPQIHNLVRLAENTGLSFTDEQLALLADINDFNIETRYPDLKFKFYQICTRIHRRTIFKNKGVVSMVAIPDEIMEKIKNFLQMVSSSGLHLRGQYSSALMQRETRTNGAILILL